MNKVPKMLSTKDLAYLSDMFNWNMIMVNKITYYLEDCEDEQLCELMQKTYDVHYKNANTICKILEEDF